MKKNHFTPITALILIFVVLSTTIVSVAHSGKTDSSGGHHDNKNRSGLGSYHYHCGRYPPHLHDNGYCPYTDVLPRSVRVSAGRKTLAIGESVEIIGEVIPANAVDTSIIWDCDNPDVISLKNGVATALGYGTATITARSFNDKAGQIVITVKEITAEKLTISEPPESLFIGESATLSCIIMPENTENRTIVWSSSDENIATISSSGRVKAISDGKTTITATASNGVSTSYSLDVKIKEVELVEFAEETALLYVSNKKAFPATVHPEDATYPELTWTSSDESVLTVDDTGEITAVGCGIAEVTATTSNGVSGTIQIEVDEILATKIEIVGDDTVLLGRPEQLEVVFTPADTSVRDIVWSTSDESILTVDEQGVAHSHKLGVVTVTAIQKDVTTEKQIEVLPVPVESIEITADVPDEMFLGDGGTFSAKVLPEDATFPEITWSSSAKLIASIDEDGNMKANLAGPVTITATTADGVSASYKLTIHLQDIHVAILVFLGVGGVGGTIAGMVWRAKKKKGIPAQPK